MVYLEEDWAELVGQHHVETQNMEAHIPIILFGLAISVLMADQRQPRDKSFDDDVLYLSFDLANIVTLFSQPLKHRR